MVASAIVANAVLTALLQSDGLPSRADPVAVVDARVCEVSANPDAWNHKRIRLSGVVTRQFENFTLADPHCPDAPGSVGIWLTLGGRRSPQVVYCCPGEGAASRRDEVKVEGLTIRLLEDATLARFVRLLTHNDDFSARATLVGTFFAGRRVERDLNWRGYGHFGCCTLFVIERVETVAPLSGPR